MRPRHFIGRCRGGSRGSRGGWWPRRPEAGVDAVPWSRRNASRRPVDRAPAFRGPVGDAVRRAGGVGEHRPAACAACDAPSAPSVDVAAGLGVRGRRWRGRGGHAPVRSGSSSRWSRSCSGCALGPDQPPELGVLGRDAAAGQPGQRLPEGALLVVRRRRDVEADLVDLAAVCHPARSPRAVGPCAGWLTEQQTRPPGEAWTAKAGRRRARRGGSGSGPPRGAARAGGRRRRGGTSVANSPCSPRRRRQGGRR